MTKRHLFWESDDDDVTAQAEQPKVALKMTPTTSEPSSYKRNPVTPLKPKIAHRPLSETRELMMAAIMSFDGDHFTITELFSRIKIARALFLATFKWFKTEGYLTRSGPGTKRSPFLYNYHPSPSRNFAMDLPSSKRKILIAR